MSLLDPAQDCSFSTAEVGLRLSQLASHELDAAADLPARSSRATRQSTMVSVIALLCAAGIAPADCTQDNAIDVIAISSAANELSCMQDSMTALASLAIQARPNEYWKVVCLGPRERISILAGQNEDTQDQVTAPLPD
jgi:hypothetical protein